jgi:hypothetical protein
LENSPVFSNAAVGKRKIVYFENKGEWRVRILLKSNSGSDRNTVLGFSKTARDGFDRNDKPKPPMHSNSRYAYFWHPEWKKTITEFASDIRQQIAPINVFQIGIAPAEDKKNNARISFNGINNLSSIFCFLADQNSITPIEEAKEYALEFSSNIVYKTIFVATDKNFLKNYPLHFTMATPYPNPCRPMATIKYVLPYRFDKNGLLNMQPFTVKLELYDIMGRKIRQLVDHSQSPGMYRVLWDGKNASGRIAASGSYFCKLEACEYSAIKKILMMK